MQSPSTAALDRAKKLRVYAREGVSHAWMVDPLGKTLEDPAARGRAVDDPCDLLTSSREDVVRAERFDAIEVELSLLWEDSPA